MIITTVSFNYKPVCSQALVGAPVPFTEEIAKSKARLSPPQFRNPSPHQAKGYGVCKRRCTDFVWRLGKALTHWTCDRNL